MPESQVSFGAVNYVVVALYFGAMLGIGWWSKSRIQNTRDFFVASGRLNHVLVGFALLATYLSSLTMMALPRIAFGPDDWLWAGQLPFLLVTAYVITRFVLPRYREAGVISVYQFLEQRIHVSARLVAAGCFVLFSFCRNGLLLYLTALALYAVTGAPLAWTIVVVGAVMILYTVWGGIEGITWTDAVQAVLFIAAAIYSIAYLLHACGPEFWRVAGEHHKFRILDSSPDPTRVVTLWLVLETVFQTIRIYGTQQDMTQRYMTTESTAKANRSVWISILGYIPLGFMFYFVGTLLFVYYQLHPDSGVQSLKDRNLLDALYPYFVVHHMPAGAPGLVIAGILSAAMSSVAALLNSSATVCVEDFAKRFGRTERDEHYYLRLARGLTVVWGICAIAFGITLIGRSAALLIWQRIMGVSTNGVLALMALAFLPRRINWRAAMIAFVVSYLVLFYLIWGPQAWLLGYGPDGKALKVHSLVWPVISNTTCFVVALVLDRLLPRPPEPVETPVPEAGGPGD